ncbi:MAG: hypothetical protein LBC82_01835 [Oscillospiraceae bacterium]|jgi:hypothetical protein|nr:hypothetical protein [Oscillospiraceae bacterium]
MEDKKINLHIEIPDGERTYILPPHPTACVPVREETSMPEKPTVSEEPLAELVRQAVDEVRSELIAELDTQVRRFRYDLQIELQAEILREKEFDNNAQIKKP